MNKTKLNPQFQQLQSFVAQIHENFETSGQVIYDERNKLKVFSVGGFDVVVKRFKIPHIINRIAYTFFRKSKARRSYDYALRLNENGIHSPAPIACVETKNNGLLAASYYICMYESEATHIRSQMLGDMLEPDFLRELAGFIAILHQKGILDLDLSPGNILLKKSAEGNLFSLIDINRMKFQKIISKNDRYKNFKRLSEDPAIIKELATEYAKICGFDVQEAVDQISRYTQRFNR